MPFRKVNVSDAEVVRLYVTPMASRKVAEILGVSCNYVCKVCFRYGVLRNKSEANRNKVPKESKHWRTNRNRARKLMEKCLGRKLESWEHVHHKDRDYTNNSLSNLEILSASAHARLHHPKTYECNRWELEARKEYQKIYMAKIKTETRICALCAKRVLTTKYSTSKFCSLACATQSRWNEIKERGGKTFAD